MLERNEDFQIPLEDIPDCFKDPNTKELLKLKDAYAQGSARLANNGYTYNPESFAGESMIKATWGGNNNLVEKFPNSNLATAWQIWRSLYIQNKGLSRQIAAKLEQLERYNSSRLFMHNDEINPDEITTLEQENIEARATLEKLLIDNHKAEQGPPNEKEQQDVIPVQISRDIVLRTVFEAVRRCDITMKNGQKRLESEAEQLLVDLASTQTADDVFKVLRRRFQQSPSRFFSDSRVREKGLDTFILREFQKIGLLNQLLRLGNEANLSLDTESSRKKTRQAIATNLKNFQIPSISEKEEREAPPSEEYDPKISEIFPEIEKVTYYKPEAVDLSSVTGELPMVSLPSDDPKYDSAFCDGCTFEELIQGSEKVFSDGITYDEQSAIFYIIDPAKKEGGENPNRKVKVHNANGRQTLMLDDDNNPDSVSFVRNHALFGAIAPYNEQKRENIVLSHRLYKIDLLLNSVREQPLDHVYRFICEEDALAYQCVNAAEKAEDDDEYAFNFQDNGKAYISYYHSLLEQTLAIKDRLFDERSKQPEGKRESSSSCEEMPEGRIVSCMDVAMVIRLAIANYNQQKDISHEVTKDKRKPSGIEPHRIKKIIRKLVLSDDMDETLFILYRHLHKDSLNGHKILLNSKSLDTYILVALKDEGLLNIMLNTEYELQLRQESQRKEIKTLLWKACDKSNEDYYALEHLGHNHAELGFKR